MKRARGTFNLLWHAWGEDVDPSVRKSYRNKCPDCGQHFVDGSRMDVAHLYIAHYQKDCPGDPAYDYEPNLTA